MPALLNHCFVAAGTGGPSTSFSIFLYGFVVGCSILAVVQLATLWGTRWGDRNSGLKSLFLSLFFHFCIFLNWASVANSHRPATTNKVVPDSTPIQVVEDPGQPPVQERSTSGNWQNQFTQTSKATVRERQQQPTDTMEQVDPSPIPQQLPVDLDTPDVSFDIADEAETPTPPAVRQPNTLTAASPAPSNGRYFTEFDQEPMHEPSTAKEVTVRARRTIQRPREIPKEPPASVSQKDLSAPSTPPKTTIPNEAALAGPSETQSLTPPIANIEQSIPAPRPIVPVAPPVPVDDEALKRKMVLRGVVRDAESGLPLAAAKIQIDHIQGQPFTAKTGSDGSYEIRLTDVPQDFAMTVTLKGYLPESRNVRRQTSQLKPARMDFSLDTTRKGTIVLDAATVVRHLGNDRFEGRINSQFQRKSEGVDVSVRFKLDRDQLRSRPMQPSVVFFAKGIQCWPEIRINGELLAEPEKSSPADGSFGELTLPFEPGLLKEGNNVISFQASNCNGDVDDFEFVNPQINLYTTD